MAVRQIPVQYARRNSVPGSQSSGMAKRQYIPLKLNASGVMPIIFAQALCLLQQQLEVFLVTHQLVNGFKQVFLIYLDYGTMFYLHF